MLLPSNGYNGLPKEIELKRGSLEFLEKVSESIANDDYYAFVQAMQTLIDFDIHKLTLPDFYALVAQARIQMFPNSPVTYTWKCKGTMYETSKGILAPHEVRKLIADGEIEPREKLKAIPCKQSNVTVLHDDDFEMVPLEEGFVAPENMAVPTVELLSEWKRLIRQPRYRYIVPIVAQYNVGETIEEKMMMIRNDLELFDYLSVNQIQFGYNNSVVRTCSKCGGEKTLHAHFDNDSFLRL